MVIKAEDAKSDNYVSSFDQRVTNAMQSLRKYSNSAIISLMSTLDGRISESFVTMDVQEYLFNGRMCERGERGRNRSRRASINLLLLLPLMFPVSPSPLLSFFYPFQWCLVTPPTPLNSHCFPSSTGLQLVLSYDHALLFRSVYC